MAIQDKSEIVSNAGNRTLQFDNPVTAGSMLVLCAEGWNNGVGGFSIFTPTDSQLNTWHLAIESDPNTNDRTEIYYAYNVTGGASFQVTIAPGIPAGNYYTWSITEVPGALTTDPLDKTSKNTGTSTAPSSGATAAVSQNEEILFAAFSSNGAANPATLTVELLSPAWTEIIEQTNGATNQLGELDRRSITGGGAVTANWTQTNNVAWTAAIATFMMATAPVTQDVATVAAIASGHSYVMLRGTH